MSFWVVRTVLKVNENRRTIEKENEVEVILFKVNEIKNNKNQGQFGRRSLGFRVDQMTLTSRKEMMERQKKLADINMEREIDCFHNMLNVSGSAG